MHVRPAALTLTALEFTGYVTNLTYWEIIRSIASLNERSLSWNVFVMFLSNYLP